MKVFEMTDIFNFGKYKGEYLLDVIVKDSGYIKDLIILNDDNPGFVLSEKAFKIAKLITKGNKDVNVNAIPKDSIFISKLKKYGGPYDFDFNDEKLTQKNNEKIQ